MQENDGAVEERIVYLEGETDNTDYGQVFTRLEYVDERLFASVEQRLLMKKVIAGVGGKAKLRKDCHEGAPAGRLLHQCDGLLRVERRIRYSYLGYGRREAYKIVGVKVEEIAVVHCLQVPVCRPFIAVST